MPAKKTNTKSKTPQVEAPQQETKEVSVATSVKESSQEPKVARPGRTLLVSFTTDSVDTKLFDTLTGYQTSATGKNVSSVFITFDTVENAQSAFNTLRSNESLRRVKYSRYPVFFHINGLSDSSDYNLVKQDLTSYVESHTGSSVLFFKLYRKENKFLGSGSLTVDTNEGMRKLLSKEQSGLKNWNTGSYNGTFYHFNKRSEGSQQRQQLASH